MYTKRFISFKLLFKRYEQILLALFHVKKQRNAIQKKLLQEDIGNLKNGKKKDTQYFNCLCFIK